MGPVPPPLRGDEISGKLHSVNQRMFVMNGWMNSGSWMWMSFMMVFWLVALGAIIYGAVRFASRRTDDKAR